MSGAARPVRWGILGTGRIAGLFAEGLSALPDAELAAVGSRTPEAAAAFGERFAAPRCHGAYAGLAADPDVDVIYIATPHSLHREHSLLCLNAGKAVLCEKPFTINMREAEEVVTFARARGLFLMEAMWTRHFPLLRRFHQRIKEGVIGEPRILVGDFGFRSAAPGGGRLFDLALGGGALLDVGVYLISLASHFFGTPAAISSQAHLGEAGVDEQSATVLRYASGQLAVLTSAIRTSTPREVALYGTHGMARIAADFYRPTRVVFSIPNQPDELLEEPMAGNGYNYEAAEVMACLRAGLTESAIMPLDETVAIMRTLDEIRAQWGLRYPADDA